MPATTIKLESDLVKKVTALKPKEESISGLVRELIEKEHLTLANRAAALAYRQFLDDQPAERAALGQWESARLVNEPKGPES